MLFAVAFLSALVGLSMGSVIARAPEGFCCIPGCKVCDGVGPKCTEPNWDQCDNYVFFTQCCMLERKMAEDGTGKLFNAAGMEVKLLTSEAEIA